MTAVIEPTAAYPTEVVTQAKVRTIELPLGAGTAAMITLDNGFDHTKPTTLGPAGLQALSAALDEVDAMTGLSAVFITGKPFIFCVGADLLGVANLTTSDDAYAIAKMGHDTLRRLGEYPFPSFAFVNGAAMGGGVEIALNCTYRTVSSSVPAFSLPEVFLGIVPGWGGAYLLPNLIGPERALKVIIDNPLSQNRQLKARDVADLGIADVMLDASDFLSQSILWAARVIRGDIVVERDPVDRSDQWDALVEGARSSVDARIHGATQSPYRALDLVKAAKTRSRDEAFAAEDEALRELIMSDQFRAGLYSFDLVQKRAKRPVGVPDKSLARPVTKVGIVGAGLMASQLALLFVRQLKVPVVMTDLDADRVAKGVGYVHAEIDTLTDKGRLTPGKANRLKALVTGDVTKDGFADADFVIEAVFENLEIKQQVFAEVEAVVSPECILATNTSSLSVTAMSEHLKHPERVIGFHFFNPVAVMPLLEIAKTPKSDDATVATAFAVGKSLRKSCVLVADAPAFVVNRLLARFLGEITQCVDEGTPFEVADRAMNPLGLPMTPFNLMALVGPAVAFHVSEIMHAHFPDRYYVSENMRKLVEAGKTAVWNWDTGSPVLDPEVDALYVRGDSPSTEEQVRTRALDALADEIQRMLDEGVVADVRDIDLCMLLGAGWPFWLGGVSPYLDRTGTSERVVGHRFTPIGVASLT